MAGSPALRTGAASLEIGESRVFVRGTAETCIRSAAVLRFQAAGGNTLAQAALRSHGSETGGWYLGLRGFAERAVEDGDRPPRDGHPVAVQFNANQP
jgi:hypothetical protein